MLPRLDGDRAAIRCARTCKTTGNKGIGWARHGEKSGHSIASELQLAYITSRAIATNYGKREIPLKSFTYAFEELPLVVAGGIDACDVTGLAEIAYDMSGAWSVQRIGFNGVRRAAAAGPSRSLERAMVWLDVGDPVQMLVYDRLEHEWRGRVQSLVDDRIFDDHNDDVALAADHAIALRNERI